MLQVKQRVGLLGQHVRKLDEFLQQYPLRKFEKDQIILVQGDTSRDIYAVKSGFVKGYDISLEGVEQLIWLGSAGDIFSFPLLFSAVDSTPLFYSAFTYLETRIVNKGEFVDFLQRNPDVLFEVSKQMDSVFSELTEKLTATEKPKATEKLVTMLSLLARRFGAPDSSDNSKTEITVPLTQQDIANLLGLTRETVATELKKLKDANYVYYDKWHFVVYTDRLSSLL
jgi:CRP/FNR family transcriptional regulator